MATADDDVAGLTFYPAFCHKASPTHFTWVKMTAADVHRLKTRRGFEGQNLYFYHNHPIQFVCVAGIIVARTEYPWRTVLIMDDSSGETIEIVISKSVPPDSGNDTFRHPPGIRAPAAASTTTTLNTGPSGPSAQAEPQHISSRTKDPLDITDLVPGTVLKAKGTLSTFRSMIQLQLERFVLLRDTNAEMRFWDEQSRYLVEVLSVPWTLEPEQVAQLRRETEGEEERVVRAKRRAEVKKAKAVEREERDRMRIQRRWEREERVREREAAVCAEAGRKVHEEIKKRRRQGKKMSKGADSLPTNGK